MVTSDQTNAAEQLEPMTREEALAMRGAHAIAEIPIEENESEFRAPDTTE